MELPYSVIQWLYEGERGISSETIVGHLYRIPLSQFGAEHPHDPDDFQRCAKLLHACPEIKERFAEMRTASRTWARLVDRWDDIERTFIEEVGSDWTMLHGKMAPRTYDLMKSVLRAADSAPGVQDGPLCDCGTNEGFAFRHTDDCATQTVSGESHE